MWALLGIALGSAEPLHLPEVLEGVDARIPMVAAAEARLDEADAKVLAKRGAFDPTLVGKASAYGGKDPRTAVDVGVRTDTLFGPELTVGWMRGVGDFPDYAYDQRTGPSGEVYGKLEIPVLDGLGYGKERAALDVARSMQLEKGAALADVERKVRFEAEKRYWAWVAAAMDLQIAEDQLELARRRRDAFARQVELGNRAPLDQVDNERVLGERQAELANARQKLELAAIALSLYLRDAAGEPRVPSRTQAPTAWAEPAPLPEIDAVVAEGRPDRAKLAAEVQAATAQQRRARNAFLPDVKVSAAGYQPLDPDEKSEVVAGLSVGAPLAFREALGERRGAEARVTAATAELRALDDAIRAEIRGALEARRLAGERAEAARNAADRATEVLGLERRRFELGGSDLFQLLQREDAAAKARKTAVEAEYALRVADAAVTAALAGVKADS